MRKIRYVALGVITLGAVIVSLICGRFGLTIADIVEICSGRCEDTMKTAVFLKIRLPRTVMAFISGMALSLAGWLYQSIFMNTLVSPDVLGVSGGCSIGAIAMILAGQSGEFIQGGAFIGGIITVLITLALARAIGRHGSISMLLAGIVIGALANSMIMLMKYAADPHGELAAIEYWLMGSLHAAGWEQLRAVLPFVLPCIATVLLLAHPVRLLYFGDDEARSMGVPVPFVKYLSLIAATGMVAGVVAVCGSISWLGLIVPHICRIAGGERRGTPFEVCLAGGALLTIADVLARSLTSSEIPISIITSFMGATFLVIVMLVRAARNGRSAL
ncbi:MAG: iron ABC transporter permease [Clostridia bacterium]|nr:iron ABC transporter permease [Clostridia bacterium]